MMKRTKTKRYLFSILLMLIMVLTFIPTMHVEAASKVKLNKTKITMYVGQTETLKVTGTHKRVIWKSSNKMVAKVSKDGKVTPKRQGTVTITAQVAGKKYHCKIKIRKPYINTKKQTIAPGKSYKLELIGTSIKSVKSSNKKVATVSKKGKVTAKKEGTATITLTGKDKMKYTCKITVKVHKHTWDAGKVTDVATCAEEGVKTYTCKTCNKTKTKSIAKLTTHSWDEGETTTKGTCTKDGVKTYECECCGKTRTEVIKAIGKHTWSEGVIFTHSTCKEEGIKHYSCRVCNEFKTEKLPKTEHRWSSYIVTKEPTCTEEGEHLYTCPVCGATKTESVAKLTHYVGQMDSYLVVGKKSTCAEEGYYNRICKRCNQIMWTEVMPKQDGHNPSEWIVDETYCTKEGKKHKECLTCGIILEEAITAETGHCCSWEVVKEPSDTAATCEDDFGIRSGLCNTCGETLEENIIRIDIGNDETALVYGYYDDAMAMECLDLINDFRINEVTSKTLVGDEWIEKECLPLEIREKEQVGAKIRAAEIAYHYSHARPNEERTWGEYFDNAENIAMGPWSAFDAFDGWMRSEGHAANIVRSSFAYTGIAVFWHNAHEENTSGVTWPFWVQGFSKDYSDIDFIVR